MTDSETLLPTTSVKPDANYLAPDGSEIRPLPTMKGGGLCHCTLPAGKTSLPMAHRQVEEIWFVVTERKNAAAEEKIRVCAGSSLTIPPRTTFQFRNSGDGRLCILMVTMPLWPGPEEAEKAAGVWSAMAGSDADAGPANVVAERRKKIRGRRKHK